VREDTVIAVAQQLRFVLFVLFATLAACSYSPSFTECEVQCAEGVCPSGMSCRSDGYCHPGTPGAVFTACSGQVDAAQGDAVLGDDGATADAVPLADALPLGAMVYVPAGPFVMGSDTGEGAADEEPEHVVTLSAFYIDVYEVTNAQWRACVAASGCTAPSSSDSNTRTGYYTDTMYNDYPVIHVDWNQASAYCAWAGKRLPTEAEWEKAARGGCEIKAPATCGPEDERTYPWGDADPTCDLANGNLGGYCVAGGDTDAVGARSPGGDSPYGVTDMAGNVYEWVWDWYAIDYYALSPSADPPGPASGTTRVERGAAYTGLASTLRAARRNDFDPTGVGDRFGVRCARDP